MTDSTHSSAPVDGDCDDRFSAVREAFVVNFAEEDEIGAQIDRVEASGCRGFALFSYSFLFDEDHQKTKKGRILLEKIRP